MLANTDTLRQFKPSRSAILSIEGGNLLFSLERAGTRLAVSSGCSLLCSVSPALLYSL